MDLIDILRLVQLILSFVSASFVIVCVLCKLINYLKVRYVEKKEIKDKKIEQKEKELFLELSKKYGSKVISDLTEAKKNEK